MRSVASGPLSADALQGLLNESGHSIANNNSNALDMKRAASPGDLSLSASSANVTVLDNLITKPDSDANHQMLCIHTAVSAVHSVKRSTELQILLTSAFCQLWKFASGEQPPWLVASGS